MFDIDKELEKFNLELEELKTKKFNSFGELECEYCRIINQGNLIRQHLIQNPSHCSQESIKVLTNQTNDISLLEDKFKCLLHVVYLTRDLFQKYSVYVEQLKSEQNFEEAVSVYEQMFNFSHNPFYKQQIANIKYQIFNQIEESFSLYKEIEEQMSNDKNFWWQFSDIYKSKNDIYNQVLCIQKALELEED